MDEREIRRLFASIEELKRKIDALEAQRQQYLYVKPTNGTQSLVIAKIVSSTSAGTNKWTYTVQIMKSGGGSHSGLESAGAATYTAINIAEEIDKTGYVNSGVSSILAIPNNSLVICKWSTKAGDSVLLFRDRNEPTCD